MGWCRKSASVVWQDKGSVTLHYTRRLFRCDFLLPPHNERVMQHALRNITRLRSCNVSTRPASSSFRTWPSRFLAPLGGLAIAAASAGILNATARIFDLRISLTDSAAPAGVYRLIGAPIRRGALVAACLPVGIARTGLTRGYLRAGDCPAGAEPVAKVIGALPGDVMELETRASSRSTGEVLLEQPNSGARQCGPPATLTCRGERLGSRSARCGCSVLTNRGAGMRATSGRFRWRMCAACCGRS